MVNYSELSEDEGDDFRKKLLAVAGPRIAVLEIAKTGEAMLVGTASLLHIECGKVIVTNEHVWAAFQARKNVDPTCSLTLRSGRPAKDNVDLTGVRVLGKSEEENADLVVLQFPPEPIEAIGKAYYDLRNRNIAQPKPGTHAEFWGFPGIKQYSRDCEGRDKATEMDN